MTVLGVGIRTVEAVMAWIDRLERFSRNRALGTYFGLVPCQDSSVVKDRFVHTTRQGTSLVRKLLTKAVWRAVYSSKEIEAFWIRIQKEDRNRCKIAIMAMDHYLSWVMLSMLMNNQAWNPPKAV